MGPTEIGLLIITGVIVMALFAYVAQNIENNRRERQLRIMQLKKSIRHASHLLLSFPPMYMTTEIQQLLVRYLQQKWEMIIELEDTPENRAQLDKLTERGKERVEPVPFPEGSLTAFPDANSAAQAQGIVKEFLKFLIEAEQKGEISKAIKQKFESRAQRAFKLSRCELDIFEGIAIEAMNGGSAALPKLKTCFIALDNLNRDHSLDRQVYELRTYVDRLTEEKKEEEARKEAERKAAREEEERMNNMTF